jgi:hypothetical protein
MRSAGPAARSGWWPSARSAPLSVTAMITMSRHRGAA